MISAINALHWRYAVKQFDPSRMLTEEQLHIVVESLRLSASSYGLQPWKFFIVTEPEIRGRLKAAAYGQSQLTDASLVVVCAVPTNLSEEHVDAYIQSVAITRGVDIATLQGYAEMIKQALVHRTPEQRITWAMKQVYLALGTLMTASAVEGIDVAAMEGFDPAQFDDILGLHDKHLTTAVIATVGFRSPQDSYAGMKKVRYPQEQVIEWIR